MEQLRFDPTLRITTNLGTTYVVEVVEEIMSPLSGRAECLRCRYMDSRGYITEGDFELSKIVLQEPML